MTPATVEADLGGDAGATAGELQTGCRGERSKQMKQFTQSIDN